MQLNDNHIVLLGNIVSKNNQLKYYADGTAILTLQVITKRRWRNAQKQWQEHSNYFSVTILGKDAEQIAQEVAAGDGIYCRAAIRQHGKQNLNQDTLQVSQVRLIKKPSALNWNQAHVCGEILRSSDLVQTINGQDLLTLVIDISEGDAKSIELEVKLKGAAAKLVASQIGESDGVQFALIEGALNGQSKKVGETFSHQYWVEGHTCLIT